MYLRDNAGLDPYHHRKVNIAVIRRRQLQPTLVLLPGKPHGQRSLAGYRPWGRKRVGHDLVTEQLVCRP